MISLNLTLLVEMVLFLIYLVIVNRAVFRPLLRAMDGRIQKMAALRAKGEADRAEAELLQSRYIERLTAAHQAAAEQLRDVRLQAYRENRAHLSKLREEADAEVAEHRAKLAQHLQGERARIQVILPSLIDEMDRQIRTEGSLL